MYNNKIKVIVLVMAIALMAFGTSYVKAASTDPTLTNPGYYENLVPDKLADEVKDIWATVVVVVQIAAVACIVFAGLRYMFASADQKADIKQGLIYLSIGAIFVFSAVTIIQFVALAAEQIL